MRNTAVPASLMCDFYKVSHREQYPDKTEIVYATWTPRSNKHYPGAKEVVNFGIQGFIMKYLIDYFNENFFQVSKETIIADYTRYIKYCLGVEKPYISHLEELHDLGYLPIEIKALPEGTKVPMRVPMMTICNTDKRFFWLTNYLETLISAECWLPTTTATIADRYKSILNRFALMTTDSTDFVPFQGHDFSMRGMEGLEASQLSGAGHLTSFVGTDTIPAIAYLEKYYGADIEKELVGCSVNATEHSVMCAGGAGNEFETYERLITEVYPTGILSIVSDTWDLWKCLSDIIAPLKDEIMARDGKIVIRPDSGDPADILCGTNEYRHVIDSSCEREYLIEWVWEVLECAVRDYTAHGEHGPTSWTEKFIYKGKPFVASVDNIQWNRHDKQYYFIDMYDQPNIAITWQEAGPEEKGVVEILWDIFGGELTEQGYKVLDSHIGAIYGDSITPEVCRDICKRLALKGFASTNVVFGIGSYTYQYNTRDTFGFAMKSTAVVIDGEEKAIFKDPITDDGTKKSNTGAVAVQKVNGKLEAVDGLPIYHDAPDFLQVVFKDGIMKRFETIQDIRTRLANSH